MKLRPGYLGKLRRAGAVAALAFAMPAQAAQPAGAPACLSQADLRAMAAYALPSALEGVIERCSPTMAAGGYLRRQGPGLVSRYAAGKQAAWPAAKGALLQFAGDKDAQAADAIDDLPDQAIQPFVDAMIAGMVGGQLKPEQCGLAERLMRLLAPLPPENTAELLGLLVQLGAKDKKGPGNLTFCPS